MDLRGSEVESDGPGIIIFYDFDMVLAERFGYGGSNWSKGCVSTDALKWKCSWITTDGTEGS